MWMSWPIVWPNLKWEKGALLSISGISSSSLHCQRNQPQELTPWYWEQPFSFGHYYYRHQRRTELSTSSTYFMYVKDPTSIVCWSLVHSFSTFNSLNSLNYLNLKFVFVPLSNYLSVINVMFFFHYNLFNIQVYILNSIEDYYI